MMDSVVSRNLIVDGARIAYSEVGNGPPVVLIHGTPSHSIIWREVVPTLRDSGYRVLVYDLLGFGQSERPVDRDTSVAAQANLLASLFDVWQIDQASIVGHDIGGAIGMIFSVHHPERACTLTLIDTVSYDSWPSETWQRIIRDHFDEFQAMPLGEFRDMMIRQLRMTVYNKDRMTGNVLDRYLAPLSTEFGKVSFFLHQVRHYNSRYTEEITDQLGTLPMPVQIIWGNEDEWQPVAYARRLEQDIPNARLTVIPEAGHFLMEDAPERVTRELLAFLLEA